ncbi:uncharacterized protein K489DRAFT_99166 [Dissoconium aciculare CBS 342.82]|uniref:Uncharacterized protein n=1 Tax=Dissoconium aciculare CBS 342.82 TaxID=1314786 RepID=A0A6J3MCR8_9PEZI|nr:uncharacterized protein K489DRAFT_99166 [Dissoconium aciculare CBS 342.82]KAF1825820.1 hypothetical protein K489DRAFT_99166 [Dissoconium aciculare CBS 342.82]
MRGMVAAFAIIITIVNDRMDCRRRRSPSQLHDNNPDRPSKARGEKCFPGFINKRISTRHHDTFRAFTTQLPRCPGRQPASRNANGKPIPPDRQPVPQQKSPLRDVAFCPRAYEPRESPTTHGFLFLPVPLLSSRRGRIPAPRRQGNRSGLARWSWCPSPARRKIVPELSVPSNGDGMGGCQKEISRRNRVSRSAVRKEGGRVRPRGSPPRNEISRCRKAPPPAAQEKRGEKSDRARRKTRLLHYHRSDGG